MRLLLGAFAVPLSLAGLLLSVAPSAREAGPQDAGVDGATGDCVSVRTDARYVPYGYNHVVILTSRCAREVACQVSTDVRPDPVRVSVAPGATVEVLTFAGSPASTFTARVACR